MIFSALRDMIGLCTLRGHERLTYNEISSVDCCSWVSHALVEHTGTLVASAAGVLSLCPEEERGSASLHASCSPPRRFPWGWQPRSCREGPESPDVPVATDTRYLVSCTPASGSPLGAGGVRACREFAHTLALGLP